MRVLAAILLAFAAAPAAEADIMAMTSGYVERQWTPDTVRYFANYGDLKYGYWAYVSPPSSVTWYGTCGFDLSPVPDSASIVGVSLSFFQAYDTGSAPVYRVRLFDDHGQAPESLYLAISAGTYLCGSRASVLGWQTVVLSESAVTAVQARLASNRIDMALVNDGGECVAVVYGCQGRESLGPRLLVEYVPQAVASNGKAGFCGRPAVVPNPFRNSARIVGFEPGSFEVLDAAGRSVAAATGSSMCDDLEPGVYFVFFPGSDDRLRVVKTR